MGETPYAFTASANESGSCVNVVRFRFKTDKTITHRWNITDNLGRMCRRLATRVL